MEALKSLPNYLSGENVPASHYLPIAEPNLLERGTVGDVVVGSSVISARKLAGDNHIITEFVVRNCSKSTALQLVRVAAFPNISVSRITVFLQDYSHFLCRCLSLAQSHNHFSNADSTNWLLISFVYHSHFKKVESL